MKEETDSSVSTQEIIQFVLGIDKRWRIGQGSIVYNTVKQKTPK